MTRKKINVTKPFLPPLDEFTPLLEQIWSSGILTNGGPMHQQLEEALCEHLGVKYLSLFANGTIALVTALKALRITGEVITTPYSFVATSHSLLWNDIEPVFVDIEPDTLNIDPNSIERAITSRTSAILPVHCYGNPCAVDQIEEIASNYNLKVVYDAAHAFGVECHCGSLLKHGDLSVLSFHATKVFNTLEGGAIICPDANTKRHIDNLKNFGFVDETTIVAAGINGKMNEIQAAMGLLQLNYIDDLLLERKKIDKRYRDALSVVDGIHALPSGPQEKANYAYFPILIEDSYPLTRDQLYAYLKEHGIYARRYFYPLISEFPMYRSGNSARSDNLPVAHNAASRIICLPIYPGLSESDQSLIVSLL
ncbi:DegT/DnrJ/EryC1/StrS family aminotransferase [Congregibacter variabilis]|uniref:DegT/DnrJ/EryC1/StrS family aminotransferase n=1 Tax=Congregibacter variabilis TaxID=3081200 RepID=A0ABZ0I2C0_9GAMM|nr:DegT/DnrJ/EryC1/StrS family aminotransferase [Congregibacter sp. IMCC43200]